MYRQIKGLTIATNGPNVGAYYMPTPYRSVFIGLDWFSGLLRCGRSHTPGVRAFVFGPIVAGRYDLQDALSTRSEVR